MKRTMSSTGQSFRRSRPVDGVTQSAPADPRCAHPQISPPSLRSTSECDAIVSAAGRSCLTTRTSPVDPDVADVVPLNRPSNTGQASVPAIPRKAARPREAGRLCLGLPRACRPARPWCRSRPDPPSGPRRRDGILSASTSPVTRPRMPVRAARGLSKLWSPSDRAPSRSGRQCIASVAARPDRPRYDADRARLPVRPAHRHGARRAVPIPRSPQRRSCASRPSPSAIAHRGLDADGRRVEEGGTSIAS